LLFIGDLWTAHPYEKHTEPQEDPKHKTQCKRGKNEGGKEGKGHTQTLIHTHKSYANACVWDDRH